MASIFKKGRDKGRKGACWYFSYNDETGKRRTKKGFTDKRATEDLAREVEVNVRKIKVGLIDPNAVNQQSLLSSPVETHLTSFESSLTGNSKRYNDQLISRLKTVFEGCKFTVMRQLSGESVEDFLKQYKLQRGFGNKTYNHYLQTVDTFGNWCVRTKRLSSNPFLGIKRLNTEVDVRRKRRALSTKEMRRLIAAAKTSENTIQGFDGEQRSRIYIISYLTGLRRKELGSLTPNSFKLDATPPTLTVEAACSKHRKTDVLPLHPALIGMVRQWIVGLEPDSPLFPRLAKRQTWLMVKKDLESVGIAYRNEDGVADFHAAGRHTHITELLRSGASLVEARELARHSDIRMTMKYTHIGIDDQAKAVSQLPWKKENNTCETDHSKTSDRQRMGSGQVHTNRREVAQRDSEKVSQWHPSDPQRHEKTRVDGTSEQRMAPCGIQGAKVGMTGIEPARPKGTRS